MGVLLIIVCSTPLIGFGLKIPRSKFRFHVGGVENFPCICTYIIEPCHLNINSFVSTLMILDF